MNTSLHQSPFWVLGASVRDDRRRIVELAEEKSLDMDSEACQRARSDLTHPRTRFSTELGWLPGLSPKKAADMMERLTNQPTSLREQVGLPTLARANLLLGVLERLDGCGTALDLSEFLQEIAVLVDDITLNEVLRDVNEDRAISGFPEVKSTDHVESDLADRKRGFRNTIKAKLNDLPSSLLIDTVTLMVRQSTGNGTRHAPQLIDELVDSYELEVQGFLQTEAENVKKLVGAARASAEAGPAVLDPLIAKLEQVVANWDRVTQAIQLCAKARGTQHAASQEVAESIRSLSVDLFNQHNHLDQTQRLTGLLQKRFLNMPEMSEQLEKDVQTLTDIEKQREASAEQDREWAQSITYRAELGVVFKDELMISPEGLVWKGERFPLRDVTRVRWGGVRHSTNGVPTGSTYTIGFGDHRSEAVVQTRKAEVYSAFTERLWRAVCIRLTIEMIETLKGGKTLAFGDGIVQDDGVTLVKHKFLAREHVFCDWSQVHVWSVGGLFYIGKKEDKKTYSTMSYINVENVHILEQCIRLGFKKGIARLSDTFVD